MATAVFRIKIFLNRLELFINVYRGSYYEVVVGRMCNTIIILLMNVTSKH